MRLWTGNWNRSGVGADPSFAFFGMSPT